MRDWNSYQLGARQTAPGVRVLRELWDIPRHAPKDLAEKAVTTDIYASNRSKKAVPRRKRMRHKH